MKNIVLGDTHADFGKLNTFINKKRPDNIFILGDFGYWPSLIEEKISYGWGGHSSVYRKESSNCLAQIKLKDSKLYFLDGNHEQHSELNQYQDGHIHELQKNIFFCSRGSSITIDGCKILFMGGARSIDKDMRTEGVDWFREETISYADYERAMGHHNIDIVMSHTAPTYFLSELLEGNTAKINDPSCEALSGIFNKYRPRRWLFGHWHFYKEGCYRDCYWKCLNYLGHAYGGKQWCLL